MIRLLNFDIAKAICIILVVIGHYSPDGSPDWFKAIWSWIYSFHMPLFMFASGYIYNAFKKEEPYKSFIIKKIKRLMIPYFIVSFIVISIKLLTQGGLYVQNPVTIESYLKVFYHPEAGYFLWFVWSLFTMFLIAPLLRTRKSRTFAFIIAAVLHYIPFSLTHIFALQETKTMFIWFMLGVCCYDWGITSINAKLSISTQKIVGVLTIVLFAIASVFSKDFYALAIMQSWLGIASVMVISTCLSRVLQGKTLNVFLILSASNYIIYLFHTTFEGFAKAFLQKVHIGILDGTTLFCVQATLVILCGIICPIILHHAVLKRFKLTKFLFGLK